MKLPLSLVLGLSLVACGEKTEETEEETEDYSAHCGEDQNANLIADDGDCDGTLTADDCDDADADSTIVADDGDCDGTLTADDCDDADADSTILADDGDCDGTLSAEDCDDADADSLTTAEDGDCDGTLTAEDCDDADADSTIVADDGDCDGTVTAEDCDDADADSTIIAEDGDCDGTLTADDCNDADPASLTTAEDGDCDGYITADDCNDEDPFAYPGSGENEANQAEGVCYSDADGDGYGDADTLAGSVAVSCYMLEMIDSYGDGWNGNEIEVLEDGVSTGVYANDSSYDGGESHWETHCIDSATTSVGFVFNDGSFNYEVDFNLYYDDGEDGILIGMGEGSGSSDFIWEGTTYGDGDTFYSDTTPLPNNDIYGTDCDDTDAGVNPSVDADTDGFNVCDDCNDTDDTINPDADEEWYDGVDQDCDGWSDYDSDWDGYDSSAYSGSCSDATLMNQWDCEDAGTCSDTTYTTQENCEDEGGTWTAAGNTWTATGDDCDDDDDTLHPLADEADPTACYEDADDDGYGEMDPSDDGITAGTDCDDTEEYAYPGAAYNELDLDGDGATDCSQDEDGDGFGEMDPSADGALAGTDCDDGNVDMAPGDDTDGDGVDSCDDCDDDDATLQGGWAYSDNDGDGHGDMDAEGELICDFTVDEDADGNPDYATSNDDCDDDDDTINPSTDADADGADACHDCDDDDGSVIGQEAFADYDGDGFGSGSAMWVCALDEDSDGTDDYSIVDGDCYDSGAWWASESAFVYPGAAYNEPDVDGDGTIDCTQDSDGDGWGRSSSTYADADGTDCDDSDADLNMDDSDTDGYSTCPDANDLSDCDDDDITTFPGAGFNEAGFDAADYETYECVTDGDGDGYAYGATATCFILEMIDSWGDGWNGNEIEVFEDGVSVGTYANSSDYSGGESQFETYCPDAAATSIDFVFNDGAGNSYNYEMDFYLYYDDGAGGVLVGMGEGSGQTDFDWDGTTYVDGDTFYSDSHPLQYGGSDSDDSDPATN